MDLVEQLLKEHSKSNCKRIVRYIGFDKNRFKELINIYLKGPYRITQRAAWPLSYCVEEHPELIKPHLNTLLNFVIQAGSVSRSETEYLPDATIHLYSQETTG